MPVTSLKQTFTADGSVNFPDHGDDGVLVDAYIDTGSATSFTVTVTDTHGKDLLGGEGAVTGDTTLPMDTIGGTSIISQTHNGGPLTLTCASLVGGTTTAPFVVLYIKR